MTQGCPPGSAESNYSGIWSDIYTPLSKLHAEPCNYPYDCFQFYSVSTTAPYWVQAGWAFTLDPLYGMTKPKSYYEYCEAG